MPADFEKKFKTGRNGELLLEKPGGGFEKVATVPDGSVAISAITSGAGLENVVPGVAPSSLMQAAVASAFAHSANPIPPQLHTYNTGNVWLEKSVTTADSKAGSWWVYVPVGDGYYNYWGIGTWGLSNAEMHVGRMGLGLIGTYTHHTDAVNVTKSGAWSAGIAPVTTYCPCDAAGNMSITYASTAGAQITFAGQVGHTLIARTVATTVGGYAIVAIDGDWTAANLCRAFTAADLAAGRCRASDLGKRYVMIGSVAVWPDLHVPLADGLDDGAHTVTFEVTGTKHESGAISNTRMYISGVVACSKADAGKALSRGSVVVGQLRPINDVKGAGASAHFPIPFLRNGSGVAEDMGEMHGKATQESIAVYRDGVDASAQAAGVYAAGRSVQIEVVATLANSDAPSTPVVRKTMTYSFNASGRAPFVGGWQFAFLQDKEAEYIYGAMLPVMSGMEVPDGARSTDSGPWDCAVLGYSAFGAGDFAQNTTGSDIQLVAAQPPLVAVVASSQHRSAAYVAILDGGAAVENFVSAGHEGVFLQRRKAGGTKIYFSRSTSTNRKRYKIGDVIRGVIGFGIKPVVTL